MGLSPILLIGPFVAIVGLVSVVFVMRHRSVQTKSMYSARRSQIERKVRSARQRTLAPGGRHAQKEAAAQAQEFAAPGMESRTAVPTATWGAPEAPPPPPPPPSSEALSWEVGPTVPPPPPGFGPPPQEPAYTPPAEPAYMPPPPPPPEPAYTPSQVDTGFGSPPDTSWEPAPAAAVEPAPAEPVVSTPAGGGAAWEIVSAAPTKAPPEEKKSKKEKQAAATGNAWQLASGNAPGTESEDVEVKRPSAAMAIAQYLVLVVGLVMVLIGVIVMVANSHAQ